jgi:hypothetical protein
MRGKSVNGRKPIHLLCILAVLGLSVAGSNAAISAQSIPAAEHSYVPPKGFVPDSMTAIRIAWAVLTPIYTARVLRKEQPFHASLSNGVWTVEGTLECAVKGSCPGGVAIIDIAKQDGRVLRVSHGK